MNQQIRGRTSHGAVLLTGLADNRHDKFTEHDFVIVIFGYTALALMQSVAI